MCAISWTLARRTLPTNWKKMELATLERNETELEEELNRRNCKRRRAGSKEHWKQAELESSR